MDLPHMKSSGDSRALAWASMGDANQEVGKIDGEASLTMGTTEGRLLLDESSLCEVIGRSSSERCERER